MRTHALRLRPGDDPKAALDALVAGHRWPAACVLSCVGSLTDAALRFADRDEATVLRGPFEIVSLTGTLGPGGSHLHLAVSDADGAVRGGHLKAGSKVHTTAEIVLGILDGWSFARRADARTGYPELSVEVDGTP